MCCIIICDSCYRSTSIGGSSRTEPSVDSCCSCSRVARYCQRRWCIKRRCGSIVYRKGNGYQSTSTAIAIGCSYISCFSSTSCYICIDSRCRSATSSSCSCIVPTQGCTSCRGYITSKRHTIRCCCRAKGSSTTYCWRCCRSVYRYHSHCTCDSIATSDSKYRTVRSRLVIRTIISVERKGSCTIGSSSCCTYVCPSTTTYLLLPLIISISYRSYRCKGNRFAFTNCLGYWISSYTKSSRCYRSRTQFYYIPTCTTIMVCKCKLCKWFIRGYYYFCLGIHISLVRYFSASYG